MTRLVPAAPADALRQLLLIVLGIGLLGLGVELLLLGHTDGVWQWVPVILLAIALPAVGWAGLRRNRASILTLRGVMTLLVASGIVGLWLHYSGNAEFELEMTPGLDGMTLFGKAMTGATPALAPGTMIQLGLLGLVSTWRHPALSRAITSNSKDESDVDP